MPATEAPLRLRVGARTERGRREENQDQMTGFSSAFGDVYLVADGMGGHRGGAEASHRVAEGYRRHLATMPATMLLQDALQAATTAVNADLLEQGSSGDQSTRGMGSTVVLVAFRQTPHGPEYVIGHIGDSRAYLLMGSEITKLTSDHSMVQRLVDENLVAAEDARNHPNANILLRAIGQQPAVVMDISGPHMLDRSARILLCSDGLWGYVPDQEILSEASRTRDPERLASNLVELALTRGSEDNITVQILCPDTSRVTSPLDMQPSAEQIALTADETAEEASQTLDTQELTRASTEPFAAPVEPPFAPRGSADSNPAKPAPGWPASSRNILLLIFGVVLLASSLYLFLRSQKASRAKDVKPPVVSPVPQPPRKDPRSPPQL